MTPKSVHCPSQPLCHLLTLILKWNYVYSCAGAAQQVYRSDDGVCLNMNWGCSPVRLSVNEFAACRRTGICEIRTRLVRRQPAWGPASFLPARSRVPWRHRWRSRHRQTSEHQSAGLVGGEQRHQQPQQPRRRQISACVRFYHGVSCSLAARRGADLQCGHDTATPLPVAVNPCTKTEFRTSSSVVRALETRMSRKPVGCVKRISVSDSWRLRAVTNWRAVVQFWKRFRN